jgi:hypothetical protein
MKRAVACVAVTAMLLAGCASPRNGLNAGGTACFKAIPPALDRVHHKGSLVGVRQVNAARLARRRPEFAQFGNRNLCLVAFSGNYQPGDVPNAQPPGPGRYALVVVDLRRTSVVAAAVVEDLPLRFTHRV